MYNNSDSNTSNIAVYSKEEVLKAVAVEISGT